MDLVISNILAYVFISYSQVSITLTMKAKILLILIVVSFVKADFENCNVIGQCHNGQIIQLITTDNQLECLRSCIGADDCQWYTYQHSQVRRNCQLFRTCESVVDYDEYEISGQKNCPTDNCRIPGFCLGTLIKSFSTLSNNYCDSACQDEPGCNYYSFSSDSLCRYCYLFQDCPSIDETVDEFESSQVGVGCPVY